MQEEQQAQHLLAQLLIFRLQEQPQVPLSLSLSLPLYTLHPKLTPYTLHPTTYTLHPNLPLNSCSGGTGS